MNELLRARVLIRSPGRDWRFWASVSSALLVFTVAISLIWAIKDADQWKARFDQASTEQSCRATASAEVNLAESTRDNVITSALIAVGRGDGAALGVLLDDLAAAQTVVAEAIAAQQEAAQSCGEEE